MRKLEMEAIYVDAKDENRIVAIKPKAPFSATTSEGSGVALVHDLDTEHETSVMLAA